MLSDGDERGDVFAFLYPKVTKCLIGKPVTKKVNTENKQQPTASFLSFQFSKRKT